MHPVLDRARRLFALAALTLAGNALAQSFPNRQIEWVVPYPPGGGTDIVARALRAAMDTTPVKARLQVLGLEATPGTPAQMADYAARERAKWGPVIKAAGIKAD